MSKTTTARTYFSPVLAPIIVAAKGFKICTGRVHAIASVN